jgi:phage shock protein PspC (stress-responsive transcriptional regulator)
VLYAVQAVYSPSFETALQNMVFFYVPFSLLFVLLSRLEWTPRLIRLCFTVIVFLALVFAGIGFVEYATKTIFLNSKLVVSNDLHTYFTVNSVFFDPDIFGRFLMLVMIGLATVLLFDRRPREQVGATLCLAVLWGGLLLTLSRSSQLALLLGLGIIAAFRWQVRRAVIIAAVRGRGRSCRDRRLTDDVRPQPGAERRLERVAPTSSRAASSILERPCGATARDHSSTSTRCTTTATPRRCRRRTRSLSRSPRSRA